MQTLENGTTGAERFASRHSATTPAIFLFRTQLKKNLLPEGWHHERLTESWLRART